MIHGLRVNSENYFFNFSLICVTEQLFPQLLQLNQISSNFCKQYLMVFWNQCLNESCFQIDFEFSQCCQSHTKILIEIASILIYHLSFQYYLYDFNSFKIIKWQAHYFNLNYSPIHSEYFSDNNLFSFILDFFNFETFFQVMQL